MHLTLPVVSEVRLMIARDARSLGVDEDLPRSERDEGAVDVHGVLVLSPINPIENEKGERGPNEPVHTSGQWFLIARITMDRKTTWRANSELDEKLAYVQEVA